MTLSSPRDEVPDQHARFLATPFDAAAVRLDALKSRVTTGEQGADTLPLLLPDVLGYVGGKKTSFSPDCDPYHQVPEHTMSVGTVRHQLG